MFKTMLLLSMFARRNYLTHVHEGEAVVVFAGNFVDGWEGWALRIRCMTSNIVADFHVAENIDELHTNIALHFCLAISFVLLLYLYLYLYLSVC